MKTRNPLRQKLISLMYLVLAIGLLLVPAALMTVIVTDDLGRALNPIHLIILAINVGWAYLPLWLLPLLMFTAGRWLFLATEPWLPPMLAFGLYGALYRDRKSTRLNSSHIQKSRMPSSA